MFSRGAWVSVFRAKSMEEGHGWFIFGCIVAVIVLAWLLSPFTIITAGERGVVLRFGAVNRVLEEGIHWRIPLVESVKKLDVKTQKIEVEANAASKDLQTVSSKIALNFHLDTARVGDLWKTVGEDYAIRVIDPAIQEAVKSATAKYTAEELITKRELVKESVKEELRKRLAVNFITLDELNIVNFDFSAQFNSAIESKVTAEQNALASKNKLEQVKFEAEQRITQAQAEAEAIKIQAQALQQNTQLIDLEAVKKWDGKLPQYMTGPVPFVNLK